MVTARRRLWGWYFFDWASQPYNTLLLTFIFGPYFAQVAADRFIAGGMAEQAAKAAAQSYWGTGLTIAGLCIAILSPLAGAVADGRGSRMRWIWPLSAVYVLCAALLWRTTPDASGLTFALVVFGLGLIATEMATSFVSALLPGMVDERDIGKVSGHGFAFGYAGGVVALFIMLLLFAESGDTGLTLADIPPILGLDPAEREGTRFVGPFTALWFAVFMIPFFLWVREPRRDPGTIIPPKEALVGLWVSVKGLRFRRSMATYLVSAMFYRDALNALFGFGGVYAVGVLGWSIIQVGQFGIIGAITAGIASWAGGYADRAFGPKPVIIASVLALTAVCVVLVGMSRTALFGVALPQGSTLPDVLLLACGALIGAAGGTVQAASRTLMVRHTTPERAAEAFGLYALSGRATSFLGPALITLATAATGNQQLGFIPLIALFLVGLVLLAWVNPDGERTA